MIAINLKKSLGGGVIKCGIPIGNVTSQVFANIYLNEFDRYVQHILKPRGYIRYGDDFIIFANDRKTLIHLRDAAVYFLNHELGLSIHKYHDILMPVKRGLKFLGMELFPYGQRLKKTAHNQIQRKLSEKNIESYIGMLKRLEPKSVHEYYWQMVGFYGI